MNTAQTVLDTRTSIAEAAASLEYDDRLRAIGHYKNYPEMMVWVGRNYSRRRAKLFMVGESHYLESSSQYHHDAERWYAGVPVSDKPDWAWIKTRNIIRNGIRTKWRRKSKTIYRNIENALFASDYCTERPFTAFTEVAFMNYFQRPAQQSGKSIAVCGLDAKMAFSVFQEVVDTIAPTIVIFTSSLAWHHAKRHGAEDFLEQRKISYARTPHPGMPWWNKKSRAYQNSTGKNHFIRSVNSGVAGNSHSAIE
jgi:hypothetical protein